MVVNPFQRFSAVPTRVGLYDPAHEKDSCGFALVATMRGTAGHDIIDTALSSLRNLEHRGAVGSDAGTEKTIPVDVVLFAMGYSGVDGALLAEQFGVSVNVRGTFDRASSYDTNVPGIFVAGDAGRGASLIVWAIAEGRAVAARTDLYLRGHTPLPSPVTANDAPIHF